MGRLIVLVPTSTLTAVKPQSTVGNLNSEVTGQQLCSGRAQFLWYNCGLCVETLNCTVHRCSHNHVKCQCIKKSSGGAHKEPIFLYEDGDTLDMKEQEMEPNRFHEEIATRSTGTGNDIESGVTLGS